MLQRLLMLNYAVHERIVDIKWKMIKTEIVVV